MKTLGSLREQPGTRGFPDFVVGSVDAARTTYAEEEALRLAWFWQGFVMDPSFQCIGKGTSHSAEYMVESFNKGNRFMHLSCSANKGSLPGLPARARHRRPGVAEPGQAGNRRCDALPRARLSSAGCWLDRQHHGGHQAGWASAPQVQRAAMGTGDAGGQCQPQAGAAGAPRT